MALPLAAVLATPLGLSSSVEDTPTPLHTDYRLMLALSHVRIFAHKSDNADWRDN